MKRHLDHLSINGYIYLLIGVIVLICISVIGIFYWQLSVTNRSRREIRELHFATISHTVRIKDELLLIDKYVHAPLLKELSPFHAKVWRDSTYSLQGSLSRIKQHLDIILGLQDEFDQPEYEKTVQRLDIQLKRILSGWRKVNLYDETLYQFLQWEFPSLLVTLDQLKKLHIQTQENLVAEMMTQKRQNTRASLLYLGLLLFFGFLIIYRILKMIKYSLAQQKRLERTLQESENRFRSIVENALDAIITTDATGLITGWNPQAETIFGRHPQEAIGQYLSKIIILPQCWETYKQELRDFQTKGERTFLNQRFETMALDRDGHEISVELTISSLWSEESFSISVFVRDITDHKQTERELEAQRTQSIRSGRLRSLGQMATGVAHELNQPLAGISATAEDIYIRLVEDLPLTPDDLKEMTQDQLSLVERMTETIEHLRLFSRDTSRDPPVRFSLNDTIQASLKLIGAQLRNHGIDLRLDLSEDLPPVLGNPHQLEQVVLNLLANGRDALDEKAAQLSIEDGQGATWTRQLSIRTCGEADEGAWVVVEVADNGVGMDLSVQEQLFEPFFTTKEADRGTGLGLSISYAIVQDHRGQLTCESRLEEGTTFRVRLPVEEKGAIGECP